MPSARVCRALISSASDGSGPATGTCGATSRTRSDATGPAGRPHSRRQPSSCAELQAYTMRPGPDPGVRGAAHRAVLLRPPSIHHGPPAGASDTPPRRASALPSVRAASAILVILALALTGCTGAPSANPSPEEPPTVASMRSSPRSTTVRDRSVRGTKAGSAGSYRHERHRLDGPRAAARPRDHVLRAGRDHASRQAEPAVRAARPRHAPRQTDLRRHRRGGQPGTSSHRGALRSRNAGHHLAATSGRAGPRPLQAVRREHRDPVGGGGSAGHRSLEGESPQARRRGRWQTREGGHTVDRGSRHRTGRREHLPARGTTRVAVAASVYRSAGARDAELPHSREGLATVFAGHDAAALGAALVRLTTRGHGSASSSGRRPAVTWSARP
jgi:hypothetical protein